MIDPKVRFSDRVRDYILYRPGYPRKAVEAVVQHLGLGPSSTVADVGAGTGKFTILLAEKVGLVYAVEPNGPMRMACTELLASQKNCVVVDGSAEATGLPESQVDAVVCAQAFHWFDREKCGLEFQRILNQDKKAAMIYNRRRNDTPFLSAYDQLLRRHAPEYDEVNQYRTGDEQVRSFFAHCQKAVMPYHQKFDWKALRGRLISCSYCPPEGSDAFEMLFLEIEKLFRVHERNGLVDFPYSTEVYWGRL